MEDFAIEFCVIVTDTKGNVINEISGRKFSDEVLHLICEEVAEMEKSHAI
jgi:oligoribonuclease (3'-5' exoribonuclease)